jgi:serine/threonine protein kinase
MISESDLQVGDVLGGFKIEQILGRGGMGVVFKAHELALNRKIALKVLASRLSANEEFLQRFKREAQVIASLKHPNIVSILTYGHERGFHFFAMEYVPGRDLREILKEKSHMPVEQALRIIRQVAEALTEAAAKGIVHRDIKPSNIIIDSTGKAYVSDFGVACFEDASVKLTQTGLFLGTPEYASPEQAKGLALDTRSDIYSLGAVLYKMLSGRPPFTGDSPLALMIKIATEPVPPIVKINPAVPKTVVALLEKMMAQDLKQRYLSSRALLKDIDHCLRQLKGNTNFPPKEELFDDATGKTAAVTANPRGARIGLFGAILGIAVAMILIVWLIYGNNLSNSERTPVQTADSTDKDRVTVEPADVVDRALSSPGPAFPVPTEPALDKTPVPLSYNVPSPDPVKSGVHRDQTAAEKVPTAVSVSPVPASKGAVEASVPKDVPAGEKIALENAVVHTPESDKIAVESAPTKVESAKTGPLPQDPTVLLIVARRTDFYETDKDYVYKRMRASGLKIVTPEEIPALHEQMRSGNIPGTWLFVHRNAPSGCAQIVMFVDIIGESASWCKINLWTMDMETAASVHPYYTSSFIAIASFRNQAVQQEINFAISGMEAKVRTYWDQKKRLAAMASASPAVEQKVMPKGNGPTAATEISDQNSGTATVLKEGSEKTVAWPLSPVVLVIVSGKKGLLIDLTRSYLFDSLRRSKLKFITPEEIPVLREQRRVLALFRVPGSNLTSLCLLDMLRL